MKTRHFNAVHSHIQMAMTKIVREPAGFLPYRFLVCGYGNNYNNSAFCWDFHHMAMRFAYDGRPEFFRHMIENLTHYQTVDGYTPCSIHVTHGLNQTRPKFHSQPYLLQAALMYLEQSGDEAWTRTIFPKLQLYLQYYETYWTAPLGLFRWPLAHMSGLDNDAATTFFQPDTIINPDVNAWIYLEYRAAAQLARRMGMRAEAASYRKKAQALHAAVNAVLWNEEAGSYSSWNLTTAKHQLSLSDRFVSDVGRYAFQSSSNLIPLYARMATPARAKEMIERYVLSADHFLSPFGIRSLSKSSEYYNNAVWGNPPRYGPHDRMTNSNWQGPVWIPLCYFVFHALRHYGYRVEAKDLADRTVKVLALSLRSQGSFAENFHGETGRPLYCKHFASWNILADKMHEELESGQWVMDPVFA